jgi:hypothetical protein
MANISSKVEGHNGVKTDFWISQINAGSQTYDIATHHSITFKDGSGDTKGTTWNGLTDLEVIIPSITDIVQSPIVFAGTVGEGGKITGNESHKDVETDPKEGYLVFVTVDCTFENLVCEAGDMAIYDGKAWKVVSGENQVSIVGNNGEAKTTVMVGSVKDVLTVEGKTLAIGLDYEELNKHISKTTGENTSVVFGSGDKAPKVKESYLKLDYTAGETKEISTEVSFNNATALANGNVAFNVENVVTNVSLGVFNPGSFPTGKTNSVKTFDVTGGSVRLGEGNEVVTSVSLPVVTFVSADVKDDNKISVITGLTSITDSGKMFLNDIHFTVDEEEVADLTIEGYLAPTSGSTATFVTGLNDNTTNVITSITAGEFKLVEGGTDIVTGLTDGVNEVVTAVSVTANNTDVFSSATVSDHVLSFGTTNVTSSVSVDTTAKGFTKKGVSYTKTSFSSASLVSGGFTKTSDVKLTFGKSYETTYTATPEMWKLNTPELVVSKGQYILNDTNMKATITEGAFLTSLTEGVLPTWENSNVSSSKITGSVSTELSVSNVSFNALKEGVTSITTDGTYTLTNATSSEDAAVIVGAADVLENMTATIDLSGYLKDVAITSTVVSK